MGFASDNCNIVIGARNSLLSRVCERQPKIFSLGCICHLADLCAKAGIKQLPATYDDIIIVSLRLQISHVYAFVIVALHFFNVLSCILSLIT